MKQGMEEARDRLNKVIASDSSNPEEILSISQMMDKHIVDYYKSGIKNSTVLLQQNVNCELEKRL